MNVSKFVAALAWILIVTGIFFRLYHISENDFIFYDEGFYLNWNRPLGEILSRYHLNGPDEIFKAVNAYASRSLASGKTLWFLLADLRYFWGGLDHWYFSRQLACVFGILTLGLNFIFCRKFFADSDLAWLSTALLAVLPSHVFYSHIGMQEALSTVLVLGGFYFYFFPEYFGWRTFAAGGLWGLAYFSNYRLIMLPLLITAGEIFLSLARRGRPDFRKWIWAVLSFLTVIFVIGSFNGGENIQVIFSWVFHQADMAAGKFDWVNILSYPYYLFRLDTFLFAALFFSSLYFFARHDLKILPLFGLVLVQMGIFTFASEKGARYIGVVLPFAAMCCAYCALEFLKLAGRAKYTAAGFAFLAVLVLGMAQKSWALVSCRPDYRTSAVYINELEPRAKILSSQNQVQNLFSENREDVLEIPPTFEAFIRDYMNGYHYLVLCPQAYISMTASGQRFDPQLRTYLGMLLARFQPVKTYRHLSYDVLERFVMEHNENLTRSVKFLDRAKAEGYGALRVYDLKVIVGPMVRTVAGSVEKRH